MNEAGSKASWAGRDPASAELKPLALFLEILEKSLTLMSNARTRRSLWTPIKRRELFVVRDNLVYKNQLHEDGTCVSGGSESRLPSALPILGRSIGDVSLDIYMKDASHTTVMFNIRMTSCVE
jgi:hypothetical protein